MTNEEIELLKFDAKQLERRVHRLVTLAASRFGQREGAADALDTITSAFRMIDNLATLVGETAEHREHREIAWAQAEVNRLLPCGRTFTAMTPIHR